MYACVAHTISRDARCAEVCANGVLYPRISRFCALISRARYGKFSAPGNMETRDNQLANLHLMNPEFNFRA